MIRLTTLPLLLHAVAISAQTYSLSPTFGTAGVMHVDIAAGTDNGVAHVLQPDGKLLIATRDLYRVSLMRLDTVCGVPDPTFGDGGTITHNPEACEIADIALQADGRIVSCGWLAGNWNQAVFRYMPDGSIDSSFNGTGCHQLLFAGAQGGFTRCFVNADSSITCTAAGPGGIGAARFTTAGALDPDFGSGGTTVLPLACLGGGTGSGLMRPDSSVVSIGASWDGGSTYLLTLAQFDFNGEPDTTFGDNGLVITPVPVSTAYMASGTGASLLPDGRILVSCTAPTNPESFLMVRLLDDGTVDSTYATNGVSLLNNDITYGCRGFRHELQADGSTLQFGTHFGRAMIVKRDADGSIVTSFGTNGFFEIHTGFGNEEFRGGFVLPGGRIIGYGSYGELLLVARVTTDPGSEPFVDLGPDLAVCGDISLVLDAGTGASYAWNDGTTEQTLAVTTGGAPWVVVTNAIGCMDRDTILVTLFPPPTIPLITATGMDLSTAAVGDLQWSINGTPIPGATGASYTVTENGNYTVTVTDANGCSSTSDPENVTSVGIATIKDGVPLIVHPVPAIDRLVITGLTDQNGLGAVAIDPSGRRIALSWIDRCTLDIDPLTSGNYALEISDHERITYIRFIKR